MENQFFKSLSKATDIFEKSFDLLKERKIDKFDQITINSLIDSSSETFQIMKQRPKILKEGSRNQIEHITQYILSKNQTKELQFLKEYSIISQSDKQLFQMMGITNLLPIQDLCFRFCDKYKFNKSLFIQYDTGQGKTSLCLGIAIKKALQKHKVCILNNSKFLLFRDFKKSCQLQGKFDITIRYIHEQNFKDCNNFDIAFIEPNAFINTFRTMQNDKSNDIVIIIDEYDSLFFSGNQQVSDIISVLNQFTNIIALSGSRLEEYHKIFISQNINSEILDFSLNQSIKVSQICHEQQVYSNIKEYRQKIVKICENQVTETPIILILGEQQQKIKNALAKLKISVQTLYDKDYQQIDSIILIFNEKQQSSYQVFIINEDQGRGLDFISNSDIEQNDGIYLIIGCLPKYYVQYQQFIGRTGRIGNKGQYSVIIYDKQAKHNEGKIYLNQTLNKLQNNEIYELSLIKTYFQEQKSCSHDQNKQLEEEKQVVYNQQNFNDNQFKIDNFQENLNIPVDQFIDSLNNEKMQQDSQLFSDSESQNIQQNYKIQYQDLNKKTIQKFETKGVLRSSRRIQEQNSLNGEIDRLYFDGYANLEIHEEMINDIVRMTQYEKAIKEIVKDKTVIDVGEGTGVLSIFAAQNDAQKVYAIEYSEMAKQAQKSVEEKGFSSKITVINEKAEFVELTIQKVDVVVSEWMGYFLLKENMLPSVLHIRDKYLKENGKMIPKSASIYLAAISKQQNIHGLNLVSIDKNLKSLVKIDFVKEDLVLSTSQQIFNIDIENDNMKENSFGGTFELQVIKDGKFNGFVGWFDVDLTDEVKLSTSPYEQETHWKQSQFLFNDLQDVKKNEKIIGKIKVYPNPENYRSIDIQISYKTETMRKMKYKIFSMD